MLIDDNSTILFQGDSITDSNRDYDDDANIGNGYANFIAAWLTARFPSKQLSFINKGINGHRAPDLEARWQADCIDLKPDWVSILIGINDTYHDFDSDDDTVARAYEKSYRTILERTRDELDTRIIICEPFLLSVVDGQDKWRNYLDHKITVARQLARDFNALYISLDGIFAQASVHLEVEQWLPDGVHPSQAGHALIAQNWLQAIGAV